MFAPRYLTTDKTRHLRSMVSCLAPAAPRPYDVWMQEELVRGCLPLARAIAREFGNIPGLPFAEIELRAQEALAKAARHFDPAKGEFQSYAARAMRNALRDLYDQQVRHHAHHVYDLDQTQTGPWTGEGMRRVQNHPDPAAPHPAQEAGAQDSSRLLAEALGALTPRLRIVAEGLRDGKSYSEIGSALGISKQAVQKMVPATLATLRDKIESMGFHGVDTQGLLKSIGSGQPAGPPPDAG